MAVDEISLPITRAGSFSSTRLPGTIGMLASPMLFAEGMLYTFGYGDSAYARLLPFLGISYLAGWACSVIGMRQLRATGQGALSKTVFVVQLLGLFLAFLFNVQEIAGSRTDSLFFRITDIAWPASHVFMLVVGVLVLQAKVWRGWRTLIPFFCGLALPVFFAIKSIVGFEVAGIIFGISTTVAFMLLGYAVRTGARTATGH